MSELRKEPVAQRWVVVAKREEIPSKDGCPFCPGNEAETPPEVAAIRREGTETNTAGWQLRIVPDKYPFLHPAEDLNKRAFGMADVMNGVGAHEIVIETPDHAQEWATMPEAQLADVFSAYRMRMLALRSDARIKHIVIVKNHGTPSGRLSHPHSHVVGFPVVPRRIDEELSGALQYYGFHERCIYCDLIGEEIRWKDRIILETERFVILAPFGSRYPFETWVIPRHHAADFSHSRDVELFDLAGVMPRLMRALKRALDDPFYSLAVHSTPLQERFHAHYHWHWEIIPRVEHTTGFEWATGVFINPTAPEEAAAQLREALQS